LNFIKTKGYTQVHRGHSRETPNQEKERERERKERKIKKKRDKKLEIMKTRNMETIISSHPMEKGVKGKGL
jgi:hypothetical protein